MIRRLLLLAFALLVGSVRAADDVDRTSPDFVRASLLVFGPGEQLYSCAGHIAFRLECPHFQLDNTFSYEGESAADNVLRFFAGKLKMGMFAVPTQEFLKQYAESGRGARQYPLDLSPAAKVRLWKLFDDLVARGADLPYDYLKRGCAQSTLQTLLQAIRPERIESGRWPEHYRRTRREIFHSYIAAAPWTLLFLHMISGSVVDAEVSNVDKVITPDDLLEYLRRVRVEGRPILTAEPIELLPQTLHNEPPLVTPLMVACLLVVLAVLGWFCLGRTVGVILMTLYAVLAVAETYIVGFSDLPASDWNWLLVPFNPLPLVLWRWRRQWALWFAGVLVAWEVLVLLAPHRVTDPAFCVLVLAYIVHFLRLKFRRV